ncbi:MAG TPA: hypothetical protein VKZ59_10525 [Acidobacteriota bacterium]|nr:hypothetical protein [Acidobacteriota bacterium]
MIEPQQRQLMIQALEETMIYGRELSGACEEISNFFRRGEAERGIKLLQQFLEGVGWISQALHMTQEVQKECSVQIDLNELPSSLEPLVNALENKDYGLVGDILVYEVEPLLDRWSGELEKGLSDPCKVS